MAGYLVGLGIDSIRLTPDSVMKTVQMLAEIEAKFRPELRICHIASVDFSTGLSCCR